MINNDVSIWIPTKDRPNFILRILQYYTATGFRGKILIGDSSNEIYLEKNKETIKYYSKLVCIYHYIYPDLGQGYVSSELVKKIDTEYSTFLSDDDIIITSVFDEALSVLNKNKDVSGVNGKSILLQVENDEAYGKIVFKKNYFNFYIMTMEVNSLIGYMIA